MLRERSLFASIIPCFADAEREYAYDPDSSVGRLEKALDDAPRKGWVVVDMKNDWKTVFPSEN